MLRFAELPPAKENGLTSLETFTRILRKCRKAGDRLSALRLYDCLCRNGLETDTCLGNSLVPLFVEVGCVSDARHIFDHLEDRDVLSWNFLLAGYNKCGKSDRSLSLYKMMQCYDSVHPNGHTFVALLKACTKLKDLSTTLSIHSECAMRGLLERDLSVGTTLVDAYAKCGSLTKAQQVFDKLTIRDTVSWTALIVGYAEHGQTEEAIECFNRMESEGVFADNVTFTSILKACSNTGSIYEGQMIHAEIERRNLINGDIELGSALVNMYVKCGLLSKSQEVFDKFPIRDVVLWTALISGYVEHGQEEELHKYLEQMRAESVIPDAVIALLSLKAYGILGALERGQEVHAVLESKGFSEIAVNTATALVDMYAKCGMLEEAQEVFGKLRVRDVATWTTLIMGYSEHGHGEEALNCFEQMELEGVSPDVIAYVCSLKACTDVMSIERGKRIHDRIERSRLFNGESIIGSTLVDMYMKFGLFSTAQEIFSKLAMQDAVAWNSLLTGYLELGNCEQIHEFLERMRLNNISPDSVTYITVLKACASVGAIKKGRQIHCEIKENGLLGTDSAVEACLIDMYGKFNMILEAQEAFNSLPVKDTFCWTAILAVYVESGYGEEAMKCLEKMQSAYIHLNASTIVYSLKACGSVGAIEKGHQIHVDMDHKGFLVNNDVLGTALVDMYAKCGFPCTAWKVFEKLQHRDLITWTTLLSGYSQVGESENVFRLFDKMLGEGIKPGPVTFVIVLNACRRAGLFDRSQMYFEAMSRDFGVAPILKHHMTIIDRMCRMGLFDDAMAMIKKIPTHANPVVWHGLLSSCRNVGNVALGIQAFEQAICVDKSDAAAYVLMSQIYADT